MVTAQSGASGTRRARPEASRGTAGWPPATTATWVRVASPPWTPLRSTAVPAGANQRPGSAETNRSPGASSSVPINPSTSRSHAPSSRSSPTTMAPSPSSTIVASTPALRAAAWRSIGSSSDTVVWS